METSFKKRRIPFYSPGLISLIFLPIIFIWHIHKSGALTRYYSMDIAWWNPSSHKSNPTFPKESHPDKKYIDIRLTGNNQEDKIKLDYAQLAIRDLISTGDTSIGVHFNFGNKSKYKSLIRAIEICRIENAKIYIPYKSDMWVFNPPTQSISKSKEEPLRFVCGGLLMNDVVQVRLIKIDEKREILVNTLKTFSIPILLYLIMTILVVKQIYCRYKLTMIRNDLEL